MNLLLASLMLLLQVPMDFGGAGSQLRDIEYQPDRVIPIEAAVGYQVTVLLSPDEQINSIAVGDSSAWQVSANNGGNTIFVKLAAAGMTTNMTVITNVRIYSFELMPASRSYTIPYILRFNYPSDNIAEETINPGDIKGTYRVTGTKALWPSGIMDDGRRTFIEWPKSADIPAVYAIDQAGKETLVNGMMREDRFVIESVASKLVFRIDSKVARARRQIVDLNP